MPKTVYAVPDYGREQDSELLWNIAMMVPSDWAAVDGMLSAPRRLYQAGNIAKNTGLVVSRHPDVHFIGVVENAYMEKGGLFGPGITPQDETKCEPDLAAVLMDHKSPSSVRFDLAGFYRNTLTLRSAMSLAAGYLKNGYRGWLKAYKNFYKECHHENGARLSLDCSNNSLTVAWNPDFGGSEQDIESLLRRAEGLGLQQLRED